MSELYDWSVDSLNYCGNSIFSVKNRKCIFWWHYSISVCGEYLYFVATRIWFNDITNGEFLRVIILGTIILLSIWANGRSSLKSKRERELNQMKTMDMK
ncbi:hypothetical protein [Piscibacillus salipiscarius]|uniref:hypothetical protein n=1 Tax=Piscibacillus salipiscarius TaxID=299480 RepID=UPI002436551A|nr:hypothetical protein [Piscibacillus salipiscarius]